MSSSDRVRGAVSTLADYTLGTVIAMFQLAIADRENSRRRRDEHRMRHAPLAVPRHLRHHEQAERGKTRHVPWPGGAEQGVDREIGCCEERVLHDERFVAARVVRLAQLGRVVDESACRERSKEDRSRGEALVEMAALTVRADLGDRARPERRADDAACVGPLEARREIAYRAARWARGRRARHRCAAARAGW